MDKLVKKTCENCGKIFDFRETDYKAKRYLCQVCIIKVIKEKYPGMSEEMIRILEKQNKDFVDGKKG